MDGKRKICKRITLGQLISILINIELAELTGRKLMTDVQTDYGLTHIFYSSWYTDWLWTSIWLTVPPTYRDMIKGTLLVEVLIYGITRRPLPSHPRLPRSTGPIVFPFFPSKPFLRFALRLLHYYRYISRRKLYEPCFTKSFTKWQTIYLRVYSIFWRNFNCFLFITKCATISLREIRIKYKLIIKEFDSNFTFL